MAFLKKSKDPFKQIQACLQKRDYKGALVWFNPLLKKDSKNTQVRLRYADTLVLAGSKREAIKQYRVVADELAESGFMIRAIAINKKIVQLDPTQTDVHEKLATMNEERSRGTARSPLPLQTPTLTPPVEEALPPEDVSPLAVEEPLEEIDREPTLSLDESMAMEFGGNLPSQSGVAPASEELHAGEVPGLEGEEGQEIVEIDFGGGDGADDQLEISEIETPSVGFELAVEEEPAAPEESLSFGEAEDSPEMEVASTGFELEEESESPIEPPSFQETNETPSFSEEPLSIGESEPATEEELELPGEEERGEIEEEVDLIVDEAPSEVEEEIDLTVDEETEEIEEELDLAVDEEPDEDIGLEDEEEDFGLEIETEPEMAADGDSPLVGLIGEDIDSLIDSIIDDVGSSISSPQASPASQATRIPLFSDLTAEEFVEVAIMLVRRSEKAGTVIVKEGAPGDSMFIVSTGEVVASREQAGRQVKLATLRDGDFFGEMAVLSGEPRTATVRVVKNTELLELSRKDLNQICSHHPEVEAKLRLAYDERSQS